MSSERMSAHVSVTNDRITPTHSRRTTPKGLAPDWATILCERICKRSPLGRLRGNLGALFSYGVGLETAYAYGLNPQPLRPEAPVLVQLENPFRSQDVEELIAHWIPLTVAMNEMNRSIGNSDYYPFVLTPRISAKDEIRPRLDRVTRSDGFQVVRAIPRCPPQIQRKRKFGMRRFRSDGS